MSWLEIIVGVAQLGVALWLYVTVRELARVARMVRSPLEPEEIRWHIPAQRYPTPSSPHDQLLAKRPGTPEP